MDEETKRDVLIDFVEDIKMILRKINNNTASARTYRIIQEYFELAGVDHSTIDNILLRNNFDGWVKFYEERQKTTSEKNWMAVRTTLAQIRGIGLAVIQNLTNEILKCSAS